MELNYSLRFKNYMRVAVISTFFIFMSGGYANAATLYMGSNEKYTNLQAALSAMKAGDTLIIRDGTYTGPSNALTTSNPSPTSSTLWTTIKAENPGSVIFDGDVARTLIHIEPSSSLNLHWVFDGIVFQNASDRCIILARINYVKFLRCGFVGLSSSSDAFYTHTCNYILVEDCYSYGSARYHFHYYNTNYSVMRRCIARHDRGTHVYQIGFQVYDSENVEVQNCIVIDSDQVDFYNGASQLYAFKVPQVSGGNINFRGCIALNNAMGFSGIQAGSASFDNCVGWDLSGYGVYSRSSHTVAMNHMTLGNITMYGTTGDGAVKTISNSIIYNNIPAGLQNSGGTTTSDYNILYNNTNYSGVSAGAHDTQLRTTPSLKYLTTGLENGPDGTKVGAIILFKIGKTGTLWGEAGYNTPSKTESLWPFPYEDIIRDKMRTYTSGGVNGARGFCADGQTLTKYIWEYLGNTIPDEVYHGGLSDSTSPSAPSGVTAIVQ